MTNRIERVAAALRGDPVDRPPVSFWFHFGLEDDSPEVAAELHLDLHAGFDLDWLKVMHDYPFADSMWPGSVATPGDLARLSPPSVARGGFARQLGLLARVADGLAGDAWFVDTVFGPWAVAGLLSGGRLDEWLCHDRAAVGRGLRVIADALGDYLAASLATGIAGVFYVVDGDAGSRLEYRDLVGDLDDALLAQAAQRPFNILHVHGADPDPAPFDRHHVAAVSTATGPRCGSIAVRRCQLDGALVGGIDELTTLLTGRPQDVHDEVRRSILLAGPRRLLIAPGCALHPGVPEANLWALRDAVESLVGQPDDGADGGPIG